MNRLLILRPRSVPFLFRGLSATSDTVFNREHKRIQRNQSALQLHSRDVDYLKDEVASRVADRLQDITRTFPRVLDLGSGAGHIIKYAEKDKVERLIQMDMSEKLLFRDRDATYEVPTERVVSDEEGVFPFEDNSFDAVVSSLSLHWVNDLPGTLRQVLRVLKPDCPFVGAMFGGDTLYELRTSLLVAQQEREGGFGPHISPFVHVRDLGGLLQSTGYNLLTVDLDTIVVNYPSMFELLDDLSTMGEGNAAIHRANYLKRDTLLAAAATYKDIYQNPDFTVPATFQICYMIGWKPSPNQPKPKPRGSQTESLKVLDMTDKLMGNKGK